MKLEEIHTCRYTLTFKMFLRLYPSLPCLKHNFIEAQLGTAASFVMSDAVAIFRFIIMRSYTDMCSIFACLLQHPDLTVTCEERVLNAILLWSMEAKELVGWEAVDELLSLSNPERLFGNRLLTVNDLLPFVRFPLLSKSVLFKVSSRYVSIFKMKQCNFQIIHLRTSNFSVEAEQPVQPDDYPQ